MSLFKTEQYQKQFELLISAIVVFNMIASMSIPQVVKAEVEETTSILPLPEQVENFVMEKIEEITESAEFPVAGEREARRTIWVQATAYSSEVAQTDSTPCIPASGYDLCEHYEIYGEGNSIAANFLRLGTQVKFPEVDQNKVFIVRDRMNPRYNGQMRIDIWMPSRAEAKQFGVRWIKMEVF